VAGNRAVRGGGELRAAAARADAVAHRRPYHGDAGSARGRHRHRPVAPCADHHQPL